MASSPTTLLNTTPEHSSDVDAAEFVLHDIERLRHWNHEDIMKGILQRAGSIDSLDDKALDSIFTTADLVLFAGTLHGRVQWEWSSQGRYQAELLGTVSLRPCLDRFGLETRLTHVLRTDPQATCSLSVALKARMQGGHTTGFHTIARAI